MDLDPDRVTDRVTAFLADRLDESELSGYVVGVSGGLDSALAARLAVDAVGADRVTGMVLPGAPSDPENMADARDLCESLGVTWREVDIAPLVDAARDGVDYEVGTVATGNVRARVRMVLEYQEANVHDLLVLGPDNRTEWLLGYFTKYGDGGVDVAPLGDLYKLEVRDLARHVGLDERFVEKTPTAGLWEGQTDEGELGASYETIDTVLRHVVDRGLSVRETADRTDVDEETVQRFATMYRESEHKRTPPPTPGLRDDEADDVRA